MWTQTHSHSHTLYRFIATQTCSFNLRRAKTCLLRVVHCLCGLQETLAQNSTFAYIWTPRHTHCELLLFQHTELRICLHSQVEAPRYVCNFYKWTQKHTHIPTYALQDIPKNRAALLPIYGLKDMLSESCFHCHIWTVRHTPHSYLQTPRHSHLELKFCIHPQFHIWTTRHTHTQSCLFPKYDLKNTSPFSYINSKTRLHFCIFIQRQAHNSMPAFS